MLLERRTRAELEELLQERLDYLRSRKGQQCAVCNDTPEVK